MTQERDHTFAQGCLWEGEPWIIRENADVSEYGGPPCKHCHSERTEVNTRYDGGTYSVRHWTCPFVVIAYNEGGYNSTGICLECLQAAVATLKEG